MTQEEPIELTKEETIATREERQEQDAMSPRAPLKRTWKVTMGGIWTMSTCGVFLYILFITEVVQGYDGLFGFVMWGMYSLPFVILALIGGGFALQRKKWGLALVGSIAASVLWGLGIPALILIAISKKEFK